MRTAAVVAEFNPFHKGHQYLFRQARCQAGASHILAVMSGYFVQRGGPAIVSPYVRAHMAVQGGADLVIQLPVLYSCQAAPRFAYGALALIEGLQIADCLVFGSELGSLPALQEQKNELDTHLQNSQALRENLKKGVGYAAATQPAHSLRLRSNDILGIEYLRAMDFFKSRLQAIVIQRIGQAYVSETPGYRYASAAAIRRQWRLEGLAKALLDTVPVQSADLLQAAVDTGIPAVWEEDFYPLLRYRILSDALSLETIADVREGLHQRFYQKALVSSGYGEFFENLRTKRYADASLRRALFNIVLGITKNDLENVRPLPSISPYARVLAFNRRGRELLAKAKHTSKTPIITKGSTFCATGNFYSTLWQADQRAVRLYGQVSGQSGSLQMDSVTSPHYIDV